MIFRISRDSSRPQRYENYSYARYKSFDNDGNDDDVDEDDDVMMMMMMMMMSSFG